MDFSSRSQTTFWSRNVWDISVAFRFPQPKNGDVTTYRQIDNDRIFDALGSIVILQFRPESPRLAAHDRVDFWIVIRRTPEYEPGPRPTMMSRKGPPPAAISASIADASAAKSKPPRPRPGLARTPLG